MTSRTKTSITFINGEEKRSVTYIKKNQGEFGLLDHWVSRSEIELILGEITHHVSRLKRFFLYIIQPENYTIQVETMSE